MSILQVDLIRQSLSQTTRESLTKLEVFREIGSTNSYLLEAKIPTTGKLHVAIAEQQTAGRGRREKKWYSPAGAGLWMSVAYTFVAPPANLPALTLAIGATVADEFANLGVGNISLKWPNDLLVDGRKLGGILVESCAGGMTAVAGIGINTALPMDANRHVKAAWRPIDLRSLLPDAPSVDALAARLIERLGPALQQFDNAGFEPFFAVWSKFDALTGREVVVSRGDTVETGVAQGITHDGALVLRTEEGQRHIVSGSVSIVIDCMEAIA